MTKTFIIRGQRIRSASQRRYIVVAGRTAAFEGRRWDYRTESYVPETYVPFVRVVRRSDSLDTARTIARRHGMIPAGWVVVVDTTTGEEV